MIWKDQKRIIADYFTASALRIFCDMNSHGSLSSFLKVVQNVILWFLVEAAHITNIYDNGTNNEIFQKIIWQVALNNPWK